MLCRQVRKSLLDFLEGNLPDRRAGEIRLHISSCSECSAYVEKLELSGRALSSVASVELDREASDRMLKEIKQSAKEHKPRWIAPRFSGRSLTIGAAVAAVVIAVALVIGLNLGDGGKDSRDAVKTTVQEQDRGPAGESEQEEKDQAILRFPGEKEGAPTPVVVFSSTDYEHESLRVMFENLQVQKDFEEAYTLSDALLLGPSYKKYVSDKFGSLGGDVALLDSIISFITADEPALVPHYLEKALFDGREVFILGLSGPPRTSDSVKLSRTEVWVMDPARYAQSPDAGIVHFLEIK